MSEQNIEIITGKQLWDQAVEARTAAINLGATEQDFSVDLTITHINSQQLEITNIIDPTNSLKYSPTTYDALTARAKLLDKLVLSKEYDALFASAVNEAARIERLTGAVLPNSPEANPLTPDVEIFMPMNTETSEIEQELEKHKDLVEQLLSPESMAISIEAYNASLNLLDKYNAKLKAQGNPELMFDRLDAETITAQAKETVEALATIPEGATISGLQDIADMFSRTKQQFEQFKLDNNTPNLQPFSIQVLPKLSNCAITTHDTLFDLAAILEPKKSKQWFNKEFFANNYNLQQLFSRSSGTGATIDVISNLFDPELLGTHDFQTRKLQDAKPNHNKQPDMFMSLLRQFIVSANGLPLSYVTTFERPANLHKSDGYSPCSGVDDDDLRLNGYNVTIQGGVSRRWGK
jgi:hypothetical protein